MKNVYPIFLMIAMAISGTLFSQTLGDFRSASSGSWNSNSTWQVYNGTNWVAATTYPGATPSTNQVSIQAGHILSTPPAGTYGFGDLYVYGRLNVSTNVTFSTSNKLIIDGGIVHWSANVNLTFTPTNATISVWNYDPSIPNGLQGAPCNNNKAIYLGTVKYAVCTGGGNADYIFDDINNAGGSITAVPVATPMQLCLGGAFELTGDYEGLVTTPPTYEWNGTGPGGYTFHSTNQNPGIITPVVAGVYSYALKVSTIKNGNTYFNEQVVNVIVDEAGLIGTASSNQTICYNTQPNSIQLTGNTGTIQWQSSTDNVNYTDIVGETGNTLSGAVIGNLTTTTYFRAMVTNGSCPPMPSNVVTVTVEVPIITGSTTVMVGNTIQLTGSHTPALATPWTSSDPAIATVDTTGIVTGVGVGTVMITYTTSFGCTANILIDVIPRECYEDPNLSGVEVFSVLGITTLDRKDGMDSNWASTKSGGYLVLESRNKGFVITRVNSTADIQNPVEGMMVYDASSNDCISIYDGTSWNCYDVQTCP